MGDVFDDAAKESGAQPKSGTAVAESGGDVFDQALAETKASPAPQSAPALPPQPHSFSEAYHQALPVAQGITDKWMPSIQMAMGGGGISKLGQKAIGEWPAIKPLVGKAATFASDVIDPELTGVISPRLAHLQKVLGRVGKSLSIPAAEEGAALGKIPVNKSIPTEAAPVPPVEPPPAPTPNTKAIGQKLGVQLEDALGAKKLDPKVPLKQQLDKAIPVPEGHTPVKSSAVNSYKYDPATREFHVKFSSGDTVHTYGDVSPEEVKAFEQAESKGKAIQGIKRNPLVAKNGKPVKPIQTDNLESQLKDSLDFVKKKRGIQ
jgi:hypothetical protein